VQLWTNVGRSALRGPGLFNVDTSLRLGHKPDRPYPEFLPGIPRIRDIQAALCRFITHGNRKRTKPDIEGVGEMQSAPRGVLRLIITNNVFLSRTKYSHSRLIF